GHPLELHVWTNRPVWPQAVDRPPSQDPVPSSLNWDAWIGPAAMRPYKEKVYHTFNWRGWYDFGTGALGDMACHTVNMPFRALKGQDEMIAGDKHEACKEVPVTIPRNEGDGGDDHRQKAEWFRMMRGGAPSYSNFDIAAYITEIILLGCVALRVGEGRRMEWDGPNMTSPNIAEAAQFVRRHNREGWTA